MAEIEVLENLVEKLPNGVVILKQDGKWVVMDGFKMFAGNDLRTIVKTYIQNLKPSYVDKLNKRDK